MPTSTGIGALIVGDIGEYEYGRDIVIENKTNLLQTITKLHHSYMSLQYPLLFPYGEDDYRIDQKLNSNISDKKSLRNRVSMRTFYCY